MKPIILLDKELSVTDVLSEAGTVEEVKEDPLLVEGLCEVNVISVVVADNVEKVDETLGADEELAEFDVPPEEDVAVEDREEEP